MGNINGNGNAEPPPILMSQAEFARKKRVSRKTVTVWKKKGWAQMVGDLVDVRATQAYFAKYATHNARGAHRPVTVSRQPSINSVKVTHQVDGPQVDVDGPAAANYADIIDPVMAEICPEALTVSTELDTGASDLAYLLVRHLPLSLARQMVDEWLAVRRAGCVGGPGGPREPLCVTEDWPSPPTGLWRDHPWFTRPPIPADEWTVAVQEAAAWREEQGLEAL